MGYSLLLFFLGVASVCATISPDKKSTKQQLKYKSGAQEQNVFERNLIEQEPSAKNILINSATYYKDTSVKRFNATVLGYVTPWNGHGYDVAKVFANKFNIISPVWFQIIKNGEEYELAGAHDIDANWVKEVRSRGKGNHPQSIQIFPRIMFDRFRERDFSRLTSAKERSKVNKLLVEICKKYGYEGFVFEFWAQLAGRVDDQYLYNVVVEMAKALQQHNFKLILVIPPYRKDMPLLFGEKHFEKLYDYIHGFSLMTYDYSTIQRPGANAPLKWIRQSIEKIVPDNIPEKRAKILMGLNMYGMDYTPDGGKPMVAGEYLSMLKHMRSNRLVFDEHDEENFFEIRAPESGRHMVFYPTLYSIEKRLQLALEMGVGISIWELGQGLDYFYDLF